MLDAMLEADGLSLDDVELHDVGYALSQVLAAGTMDAVIGAYWSYESFVLEDMGHPVEIIYPEDWGVPRYYEMMLITSDKMIEEKPDVVRRFVTAFTKGFEYVAEDGQRGIDILGENEPRLHRRIERIARPSRHPASNPRMARQRRWQVRHPIPIPMGLRRRLHEKPQPNPPRLRCQHRMDG